jgi:hypothetical protein
LYSPTLGLARAIDPRRHFWMTPRRFWLCLPPVLLGLGDHAITLAGQPASYWNNGFVETRELAPHGSWLLQRHPGWFLMFGLIWLGLCILLIRFLPRRAALAVSLAVVIGHAWGIGTWLPFLFGIPGYWLCMGFFLLTAGLVVYAWERAHGPSQTPVVAAHPRLPTRSTRTWPAPATTHS